MQGMVLFCLPPKNDLLMVALIYNFGMSSFREPLTLTSSVPGITGGVGLTLASFRVSKELSAPVMIGIESIKSVIMLSLTCMPNNQYSQRKQYKIQSAKLHNLGLLLLT